jgi:hypothetical protein
MSTPYDSKEYLDRKECALYLTAIGVKISAKTLANLAANNNAGEGPPLIRTRWSRVYYRRIEVEAWAKDQTERIE